MTFGSFSYPDIALFFPTGSDSFQTIIMVCILYKHIMILSLSIVIVAAVLASIALFFLLGSRIDEFKKQNILILMGLLIFLSILISTFKSHDILTFSLLHSSAKNKISSLFVKDLAPHSAKYNFDQKILGDNLFQRNYALDFKPKDYSEFIIFASKKNFGASYFANQLTRKYRVKGLPAFYVKMESPSGSAQQFFKKTGFNSYQAFKASIEYYLEQNIKPYITVDNAELLPRPVWDILASFQQNKSPHIILNTQNVDTLLDRISQIKKGQRAGHNQDSFLQRFQVQKFNGPDQSSLQKLSPANSLVKKIPINFQTINQLKNGMPEQEIVLKSYNMYNNVANYFGLGTYYNQIKRLVQRGSLSYGRLRQTNIPFQKIQMLDKLGLININNGEVTLL